MSRSRRSRASAAGRAKNNQSRAPGQPSNLPMVADNVVIPAERSQAGRTVYSRSERRMTLHQGPLPHPSILAQYNEIIPNGAERVMVMAENQSEHRMWMEKTALTRAAQRAERGLWVGGLVVMTVIIGAVWLGMNGHDWLAGTFGVAGVTGLAGVFVYGSNNLRSGLRERAKIMTGKEKPSDGQAPPPPPR